MIDGEESDDVVLEVMMGRVINEGEKNNREMKINRNNQQSGGIVIVWRKQ